MCAPNRRVFLSLLVSGLLAATCAQAEDLTGGTQTLPPLFTAALLVHESARQGFPTAGCATLSSGHDQSTGSNALVRWLRKAVTRIHGLRAISCPASCCATCSFCWLCWRTGSAGLRHRGSAR